MRIVYVVPGAMPDVEVSRRGTILRSWASPGVEADIIRVTEGPASIESMYEEYLSIPATAKTMFELEQQGYDAAILGCAGDPGLDAMREITSRMVVVGPGESSMLFAAMLGYRFSVLTVLESTVSSSYELAHKAGVAAKLASVRAVNVPVLELATDRAASLEKIISAGRAAIQEDRAHVLVLGCMTMAFLDVAREVEEALQVPVVNPAKVALKAAEALVGAGLHHSKKAYMLPPKLAEGKVKFPDELLVR